MTRQEARKKLFDFLHADWLSWTPDSVDALQMAIDALGSDTNVGSKGDMIYRQDAIHVVSGLDSSFVKYIEELPFAQPDIIRCKDCRWQKDQSESTAWLPCRAIVTPSDFYCGRAERRTDE